MKEEIKIINYSAGSTVLVENSVNEGFFYIIKSGTVSIQSDIKFKDKVMKKYETGDSFGIVSGLTKNPIRNTLIVDTDCEIVRIPLSNLGDYLYNNRQICLKIISSYSNQLRALDSYLVKSNHPIDKLENPENLLSDSQLYIEMDQDLVAAHCLNIYIKWAEKSNKNPKGIELAKSKLKEIGPDYKFPVYESNAINLEKGEIIFVENEPADFFYIIEEGAIKISKLVNGQEFILCILKEGEIFGEMAILNKRVRNATAVAFEKTKLVRLSVENFMDDVGSKIVAMLFEIFSRRIWYAHQRALLVEMSDPNAKLYCYLQILISDINVKNRGRSDEQMEYIFNFTLNELLKMVGCQDMKGDFISEFLTDENIDISNHSIRIFDRRKIDDKAGIHRARERQKRGMAPPK